MVSSTLLQDALSLVLTLIPDSIQAIATAQISPFAPQLQQAWDHVEPVVSHLISRVEAATARYERWEVALATSCLMLALFMLVSWAAAAWAHVQQDGGVMRFLFSTIRSLPFISGALAKVRTCSCASMHGGRAHTCAHASSHAYHIHIARMWRHPCAHTQPRSFLLCIAPRRCMPTVHTILPCWPTCRK